MFDRFAEIELNKGKNNIHFEFIGSLRNTFGPLHHQEDELTLVCPDSFTFEGDWTEKEFPETYKERYSFIGFGINKIILTKISKEK